MNSSIVSQEQVYKITEVVELMKDNIIFYSIDNKGRKVIYVMRNKKIIVQSNAYKLSLDKDYISRCIDDIRKSTKNRYDIFDFQYDISPNPVLSTIVQVVDDTNANFQRRNNILSENVRYVGISFGEIKKGIFCFYLLFAS